MDGYLKQSTASQTRWIGPFVDDTDFKTAETGLSIANTDIKVSKNGGASASKNSGGGTHDVNGYYAVTWDATDTATVGQLSYSVKVAGALQVFGHYVVVEEAIYDALFAASATGALPVSASGISASAFAAGAIDAAAIANGAIDAATFAAGAIDATAIADNAIDAGAIAANAITAAKIADGAIDAATFAADVDAEILSYIVDDATRIDASALNTASVTTVPAIVADTNELQTDWVDGGRLDLLIDAIYALLDTEMAAVLAAVDTEIATLVTALTSARTLPGQGDPPVNASHVVQNDYMYKSWRNKKDNDGTVTNLYADDGTTVDHKQTTSESGGTVTKGEWTTGA